MRHGANPLRTCARTTGTNSAVITSTTPVIRTPPGILSASMGLKIRTVSVPPQLPTKPQRWCCDRSAVRAVLRGPRKRQPCVGDPGGAHVDSSFTCADQRPNDDVLQRANGSATARRTPRRRGGARAFRRDVDSRGVIRSPIHVIVSARLANGRQFNWSYTTTQPMGIAFIKSRGSTIREMKLQKVKGRSNIVLWRVEVARRTWEIER